MPEKQCFSENGIAGVGDVRDEGHSGLQQERLSSQLGVSGRTGQSLLMDGFNVDREG